MTERPTRRPDAAAMKRLNFASGTRGNFDLVAALFCALLLISNICATKLITIGGSSHPIQLGPIPLWPLITDGGALLFPFTYIFGDVLAEVYGMTKAKRAIWMGFAVEILASATFLLVDHAPAQDPAMGSAFHTVLAFVPRIVLASLCGYLAGQFVNAWVLVRIKRHTKEGTLWARLVGSTVAGEFVDTALFCVIAFGGLITMGELANYTLVGYVYKCLVEILFLPLTYAVIRLVKRGEPDYWAPEEP